MKKERDDEVVWDVGRLVTVRDLGEVLNAQTVWSTRIGQKKVENFMAQNQFFSTKFEISGTI